MSDREQALIMAARRVTEELQYDPHFTDMQSREIAETRLFLARMDALNVYYQSLVAFKFNGSELIPIYSHEVERRSGDLAVIERTSYPLPRIPDPALDMALAALDSIARTSRDEGARETACQALAAIRGG